MGGDDESGGHRIVRNVAFNNLSIGFSYNTATIPIEVFHNTAWSNPHNYSFYDTEHYLANNISYSGEVALDLDIIREDHNTWNFDIDDPEFVSTDPDDERFLHLSEDSPCIEAGTDVGIEYRNEAPDIGAYEYREDGIWSYGPKTEQ